MIVQYQRWAGGWEAEGTGQRRESFGDICKNKATLNFIDRLIFNKKKQLEKLVDAKAA